MYSYSKLLIAGLLVRYRGRDGEIILGQPLCIFYE